MLEERVAGQTTTRYAWSAVYVDALIMRQRDDNADGTIDYEERLYALNDANYNVTALADWEGNVVERYLYDPYGSVTVIDADWTSDDDGISDVGWQYLHQGGRFDTATGLYHFRHRDYDPNLGRWLQQDPNPAGVYADGMNLYQYAGSSPVTLRDPEGLQTTIGAVGGGGGARTRPGRYEPGVGFIPDPYTGGEAILYDPNWRDPTLDDNGNIIRLCPPPPPSNGDSNSQATPPPFVPVDPTPGPYGEGITADDIREYGLKQEEKRLKEQRNRAKGSERRDLNKKLEDIRRAIKRMRKPPGPKPSPNCPIGPYIPNFFLPFDPTEEARERNRA